MEYSNRLCVEMSLINMDGSELLTKINQLEKHDKKSRLWRNSITHLQITCKDFPVGLDFWKARILALDLGL